MQAWRLPADTRIGRVRLRVGELQPALEFYEGVLGLTRVALEDGEAVGLVPPESSESLVVLQPRSNARRKPNRTVGLYHYAILLPDRPALATVLLRLRDARWPLQGLSDHAVSEAIYLADPDGNGIEIYADRPRETWPRLGTELQMTTLPLDVRGLLSETGVDEAGRGAGLPAGTRMGHVHLHVADLAQAEAFYADLLGLDIVTRRYPGALFMSAGGYHHHVAVNVWAGQGAPRPPADSVGLLDFGLLLPDHASAEQLIRRLREAGLRVDAAATDGEQGWRVEDPDGNGVLVSVPVRLPGLPESRAPTVVDGRR